LRCAISFQKRRDNLLVWNCSAILNAASCSARKVLIHAIAPLYSVCPDREETKAPPYEGIENLRPESIEMVKVFDSWPPKK
jgi:hypothetical protein